MLRRLAIPGAYLFVVLAFAISTSLAFQRVQETDNRTRCAVVGLVDQLATNASRNAQAVVASPTATPEQRTVAKQNLDALVVMRAETRTALRHPHGKVCP